MKRTTGTSIILPGLFFLLAEFLLLFVLLFAGRFFFGTTSNWLNVLWAPGVTFFWLIPIIGKGLFSLIAVFSYFTITSRPANIALLITGICNLISVSGWLFLIGALFNLSMIHTKELMKPESLKAKKKKKTKIT